MTFDGKAFGKDVVAATKAYVDKAVAPLLAQIDALKAEIATANTATQKAVDAHGAKLALLVKDEVGNVLAGWEKPKDGRDGADGAPGTKGDPGSDGKDGQNGRDGVGMASAMIDRTGALILTLSDGTTRELGHVVGKDADMVMVKGMIEEATRKAIAEAMATIEMPKDGRNGTDGKDGAPGRDGKDAEPITKEQIIEAVLATDALGAAVEQYLTDNPPPAGKDGRDGGHGQEGVAGRDGADGKNGENGAIGERGPAGEKGEKGDPGDPGQAGVDGRDGTNGVDGKSVTVEDVRPLVDEAVTKAVTLIHVPKDGKDGAPGINGKDGADGRDGKDGRDGVDVKDLLVVEGGELVATFTDGRVKNLGQFRGKDGEPGKDGANGADGKDGLDGIGFDDVAEEVEDEGRITIRRFFHAGQMVKESRIQTKMTIFRGVHDQNRTYQPGDMVSRGGSLWHCDAECHGPFNGDNWTLSVKKGRDGKPD